MTVKELKKKLEEFDDDMLVVVCGFDECGYDRLKTVEEIDVYTTTFKGGHFPEFDDKDNNNKQPIEKQRAVLINF